MNDLASSETSLRHQPNRVVELKGEGNKKDKTPYDHQGGAPHDRFGIDPTLGRKGSGERRSLVVWQ